MTSALEVLQLTPSQPGSAGDLVAVNISSLPKRIEEQAFVHHAAAIRDIDYVFFRRFDDGRSSRPCAYVVDNSDNHLSESDLSRLHYRTWLDGGVPLLYVGWSTRVDILSCARGPDFWTGSGLQYDPAERLNLARDVSRAMEERRARFSASSLSNGTFWENPKNSSLAESGKTAHRQLIAAVIEADNDLEGQEKPVLRRLLLLTVLIKYLEDRGVFPAGWFGQFQKGANTLFEVLQNGNPESIRELLRKLERKFNGDVFELPEDARNKLTEKELRRFAELVEARTINRQRYLWSQYAFKHIPVEVLSHLYQHFAQRGKGAVFTPPILAHLMLDYAMPYASLSGEERVFDPTCGSGVFLVAAFRRLVQKWRSQNDWRHADVETLKGILKRCIFGAELQEEAAHLTAFSLSLAICDALQPNVIWKELRFDKLVGANIRVGDTFSHFKHFQTINGGSFAVVVGNPPFESKLTETAARSLATAGSTPIPDNQMAYAIADRAMGLLRDEGTLCLIQPHGFLYNEKPRRFQKSFLRRHQVNAILDFTSIRNLYDGADPKTVAVLACKRKPAPDHRIMHLTFRRTFSIQERIAFELDHYDSHSVPQSTAETYPWIWRTNLLGGGRLFSLAERLDEMPKLHAFVRRQSWDYGEGFIAATTGRREPARWLTGKPCLPTEALTESGIDDSRLTVVRATRFRSAYSPKRYTAPLVLIRENETLPSAFWRHGFLAYKDKIVGIHAESSEQDKLEHFYRMFVANKTALRAFCLMFGTQAMMGKSTAILKRDLDVLPWPNNGSWDLSKWEEILCDDLVDFMADYVRLGQNSDALRKEASKRDFARYADVFVEMLGTVYRDLRPIGSESNGFDGLAFQAFCFDSTPEVQWPSDWASKLREMIYIKYSDALQTSRILRFYDQNAIVIIKPNRLRYWIRSTAIRDADETLVDLTTQGY